MFTVSRLMNRVAGKARGCGAILLAVACGFAQAQAPVATGSIVPTTHATWGQIYKVTVAKNGSVVFLDWANSGLYQLQPGLSTFNNIASGAPLEAPGTYWNSGMTIDAKDTLYLADRYGNSHFFRIPYNPADGTWDFTSANAWGATIGNGTVPLQTYDVAFIDSSAKDGSGTLVVSTETSPQIFTVPVDNQGNWGSVTVVIKGLKARATHIAADVNGNIYYIEDSGAAPSGRVTGVFMIPAGKTGIVGAGDGSAEAQCSRIDPSTNNAAYSGISLDTAGNIYLASQANSNGGLYDGDLVVPNTSGSPVGINATSFDWNKTTYITPVSTSAPLAVDPRGYLWLPTAASGWTPNGSLPYPGTNNVALWQPGAGNAGVSPVGTINTPTTVYFSFSLAVTPAAIGFQQQGMGSDFVASSTNPIVDPTASPVQAPCTAGKQYVAFTSCPFWISLDPRAVGSLDAKLAMTDTANNVISNSLTYITGIGQGPAVSLLSPTGQATIGNGFNSPQQVTGDAVGNVYVADPGLGKVLVYPAGSTTATAGVSIGKGLVKPTGVSVDGAGDVFIADSGNVYEIPFANGALNAAAQSVVASGLGTGVQLAAGLAGNVYAADPTNARVIEIFNAQNGAEVNGYSVIGSGFSKPTAIALDNSGNVYVGDGNTLYVINGTFSGPPAAITKNLVGPITGIAIDPSGSVNIAQAGGIVHIPNVGGTLNVNSAVALDNGVITAPNGLGIDGQGNLFVSDLTGGTANLQQLTLGANVNFGQVSPFVPSNPVDVSVYDIGNLPLLLTAAPTFGGTNGTDFSLTQATQNGCDVTGGTSVAPGTACILDPQVTASADGTRTGTMTVTTNAVNAASVTSQLTAVSVNNLERSAVAMTITPATTTYPGSTTVAVTVAPTVSTATPTGQVILTLINQNAKLNQATTYPAGTLVNGKVMFSLSNILGGVYTVKAVYHGDANFSGGLATGTLTVAQAKPTVTLSNPANVKPIQGSYYVALGSSVPLTASVSSAGGTPTGNVTFLNGTSVADPKQNPVTLDANGHAVFTTGNLSAGTYALTATFNGDQNFGATPSSTVTFVVLPPSVLLSTNPASMTLKSGSSAQAVVTLTSVVGYAATKMLYGGVNLACDTKTVPKYAECTFDVQQVLIDANGTATATLTLSTNLPVNVASGHASTQELWFAGFFCFGMTGLMFRRRAGSLRGAVTLLGCAGLAVGLALGASGCTNGGYTQTPPSPHVVTPAGMYNISIVATDPYTHQVVTLPFTLPVTVQ